MMKYTDFNINEHGFVGHMAEPEAKTKQAVIVIMGGEKVFFRELKLRNGLLSMVSAGLRCRCLIRRFTAGCGQNSA